MMMMMKNEDPPNPEVLSEAVKNVLAKTDGWTVFDVVCCTAWLAGVAALSALETYISKNCE